MYLLGYMITSGQFYSSASRFFEQWVLWWSSYLTSWLRLRHTIKHQGGDLFAWNMSRKYIRCVFFSSLFNFQQTRHGKFKENLSWSLQITTMCFYWHTEWEVRSHHKWVTQDACWDVFYCQVRTQRRPPVIASPTVHVITTTRAVEGIYNIHAILIFPGNY